MSAPKKILFFLFFSFPFLISSQEIKKGDAYAYARRIVDTMASAGMHGRGYVHDGDSLAAAYISGTFQQLHLESFGTDYYQHLSFPVNSFPFVGHFSWSGFRDFVVGKDYIIAPSSGPAENYSPVSKVVWLDSATYNDRTALKKFLKKKLKYCYVATDFDVQRERELMQVFEGKARAVIFTKRKKLTADFEQSADKIAAVELLLHDSITIEKLKTDSYADLFFMNKLITDHPAKNVIGYVRGAVHPDSFIVFTAHYDHIGEMGPALFPGANDNASGCAMLLNLARHYSMPGHRPGCSIVFMAFCGEEVGLLGSRYYNGHPLFPLSRIRFLLNMDIMGTGEEGVTIVNGTVFKKEFDALKKINDENHYIKDVKIRGKAANSDHYFFAENGVHACFMYTMGGITAYHDIYDRAETLPLNEFQDLFELILKFEAYLDNE